MALGVPAVVGSVTSFFQGLGGGTTDAERKALVDAYYQRAISGDGVALEVLKCWAGQGVVTDAVAADRGAKVGEKCGMASEYGKVYAATKYAEAYARVNGGQVFNTLGLNALAAGATINPAATSDTVKRIGLAALVALAAWFVVRKL